MLRFFFEACEVRPPLRQKQALAQKQRITDVRDSIELRLCSSTSHRKVHRAIGTDDDVG